MRAMLTIDQKIVDPRPIRTARGLRARIAAWQIRRAGCSIVVRGTRADLDVLEAYSFGESVRCEET